MFLFFLLISFVFSAQDQYAYPSAHYGSPSGDVFVETGGNAHFNQLDTSDYIHDSLIKTVVDHTDLSTKTLDVYIQECLADRIGKIPDEQINELVCYVIQHYVNYTYAGNHYNSKQTKYNRILALKAQNATNLRNAFACTESKTLLGYKSAIYLASFFGGIVMWHNLCPDSECSIYRAGTSIFVGLLGVPLNFIFDYVKHCLGTKRKEGEVFKQDALVIGTYCALHEISCKKRMKASAHIPNSQAFLHVEILKRAENYIPAQNQTSNISEEVLDTQSEFYKPWYIRWFKQLWRKLYFYT